MAVQTLPLGQTDHIQVDIDLIISNFIKTAFGSPNDPTPSKQGVPGVSSGGLKSLLDAFIKFFYKVIGLYTEKFTLMIAEILAPLIPSLLFNLNIPDASGNPTPLSDTMYYSMLSSNPATASLGIAGTIDTIKNIISQIELLFNQVITPIISFISDTNTFLQNLLGDTFSDFTLPVPAIEFGILGLEFLEFDLDGLLDGKLFSLIKENINVHELGVFPESELKKVLAGKQKNNIPSTNNNIVDTSDINFYKSLQQNPIFQRFYINQIYNYGLINQFYQESFVSNIQKTKPLPQTTQEIINMFNTPSNGYYQYTFDFFNNFPLYSYTTTNNSGVNTKINGLYDFLLNSNLITDTIFITNIYNLIESYSPSNDIDISNSTLPDLMIHTIQNYQFSVNENNQNLLWQLKETYQTTTIDNISLLISTLVGNQTTSIVGDNTVGFFLVSNGVIISTANTFTQLQTNSNIYDFLIFGYLTKNGVYNTDSKSFINVLQNTFQYNFWNTLSDVNSNPYLYCNGLTGLTILPYQPKIEGIDTITPIITLWNYKNFKLQFWNQIPENDLQYFNTYVNSVVDPPYILDFIIYGNETDTTIPGLTSSVYDWLRISNYRVNEKIYTGILNDNNFRNLFNTSDVYNKYGVSLPTGNTSLFGSNYDPNTGLPNFLPSSFEDLLKKYNTISEPIGYMLTFITFMKNLFIFPINLLLGYIEKFLVILKDLASLNIPKVITSVTNLITSLPPTLSNVKTMVLSLLSPFIIPLITRLKNSYDNIVANSKNSSNNTPIDPNILDFFSETLNPNSNGIIVQDYILDFKIYYKTINTTGITSEFESFDQASALLDSSLINPLYNGLKDFLKYILRLIKALIFLIIDLMTYLIEKFFGDIGSAISLFKPVTNLAVIEIQQLNNNLSPLRKTW